jgi:hypothetical protein
LLNISDIGKDRLSLQWVSASEAQLFSDYVTRFSKEIKEQGAFYPEQHRVQLDAIERTLNSSRLRWLVGMESSMTGKGNIFHETIVQDEYRTMVMRAGEDEYHGSLILEVLKEGPQSAREIAFKSGLPLYTVSLRLNDLERSRKARLSGFDGIAAKFSCATL